MSERAPGARTSGASIELLADRVVKRQGPTQARAERERSEYGLEVARVSGLFRVPRILDWDESQGVIVFERLHGYLSLGRALAAGSSADALAVRAGRALACIHHGRRSSDPGTVAWHGDFGVGNLLYRAEADELAILDWSNAQWAGHPAERAAGPAGVDLGIFLISLFFRRVGVRGWAPTERHAAAFLASYGGAPGLASLEAELPVLTRRWTSYWARQRGRLHLVAYLPSLRRMRRFLAGVDRGATT